MICKLPDTVIRKGARIAADCENARVTTRYTSALFGQRSMLVRNAIYRRTRVLDILILIPQAHILIGSTRDKNSVRSRLDIETFFVEEDIWECEGSTV